MFSLASLSLYAQQTNNLTIKTHIDSTYVFGFDLTHSRLAKGGIWNLKTGKAETPLSFSSIKNDTINGKPVIMLFREVVPGNHPLNGWEPWTLKDGKWVKVTDNQ